MSLVDTSEFEAKVSAQGYQIFQRTLDPLERLNDHVHDYDVWGLVTSGEFRITVDGTTTSYRAGQEFRLPAGCDHSESAGPEGVAFVVGRRTR